jgi:glycosyltransferase involved in cell wall biosynthesis
MTSHRSLLVFADDWGRHPSSAQHLVRHLLPRFPTLWVNTIGTRKPRFDLATLRRGWDKLRFPRRANNDNSTPNLRVISPLMWPYFTRRHDRWFNQRLLSRAITPRLQHAAPVTAITTLPLVADLIGTLPVERWVYYCVDDFSQWPGLDGKTLEAMERDLVPRVDAIVAAGRVLQQRIESLGRPAHLLTHGVDLDHWQSAPTESEPLWPELPRPLCVFWGLIDRRLDTAWLTALSNQLSSGTILLVGPTQNHDPSLERLPRVAFGPAVAYDELPYLARAADVLIMPYADLPVTLAMQPLKLLEYLATGKPVIARALPAVTPWNDALDACDNEAEFAAAVVERLSSGLPQTQRVARQRLSTESWQAKAEQFAAWLK